MPRKPTPPALTREGRENQLIDLAIDQAEKELREGTASSQVLVHYLKLASTREKREKEKMEAERCPFFRTPLSVCLQWNLK